MSRIIRVLMIVAILAMGLAVSPVKAEVQTPVTIACPYLFPPDNTVPPLLPPAVAADTDPLTGSNYCVWAPPGWDGKNMVIYAHGYVDRTNPLRLDGTIPLDQLVLTDPTTHQQIALPNIILGMGYAFAAPSYSKNGLAVTEGVAAVDSLAAMFKALGVKNVYLVGVSEGGLVTALAIEKNPLVPSPAGAVRSFTAGVSTCGPVGDFRQQINYWGDFRVAFDYFFGGKSVLPNSPIDIAQSTIGAWGTYNPLLPPDPLSKQGQIEDLILAGLALPSHPTQQLLSVSKAPIDPANPVVTTATTVLGILDYNVKATDEGQVELGGNPFDNTHRFYFGSANDLQLNQWIKANDTYAATGTALAKIAADYQTTGKIKAPLVTLHTTGDPIVPYWHEPLYALKVWLSGNGLKFFSIPINRYGHCAFTPKESIFAFALAVFRATGTIPVLPITTMSADQTILTQQDFDSMLKLVNTDVPKIYYLPIVTK
jgi:pimeloyl-ACP methyl ester carboxylesterase